MFKILVYNIHHGNDSLDVPAWDEQASVMAAAGADLIAIVELEQYTSYGNLDMLMLLQEKLAAKGLTYPAGNCFSRNAADGSNARGQHLGVLSRNMPSKIQTTQLHYTSASLHWTLTISGRQINFCLVHLEHGQAAPGLVEKVQEGKRCTQQIDLNYAVTNLQPASTPRIFLGDFNTLPDGPSLDAMRTWYYDAWLTAGSRDSFTPNGETYMAGDPPDGVTDYDRRIDYVFYGKRDWNVGINCASAKVIDTRRPDGSLASDHNPLLVTLAI